MDKKEIREVEKYYSKKFGRELTIYDIMIQYCPDDYFKDANALCDNVGNYDVTLCESCWKDVIGDIE